MSSDEDAGESRLFVMMPVGIGHVFVLIDENEWHDIESAFADPHVVELDDSNGDVHTVDLADCVSNAIVKNLSEIPTWEFFVDIESQGVQVFDAICWAKNPEKQIIVEAPFYQKMLDLIKDVEGRVYDTRAVGLSKSRIQFDCKGKRYNAYIDASGAEPTVRFGHELELPKKVGTDYIEEIRQILISAPDPAFVPDEEPRKEESKDFSLADLSAFDMAFSHDDADKMPGF